LFSQKAPQQVLQLPNAFQFIEREGVLDFGIADQFGGYTLSLGNFLSRLYAAPSTTTIS
jgi:hypothetical protein